MTHLKANCGCGWAANTQNKLTAEEVIRAAALHANQTGHTTEVHGVIHKSAITSKPGGRNALVI